MIAEVQEGGFKPVKITLTIESKQELQELWHRLNISMSSLGIACRRDASVDELSGFDFKTASTITPLWFKIDEQLSGDIDG